MRLLTPWFLLLAMLWLIQSANCTSSSYSSSNFEDNGKVFTDRTQDFLYFLEDMYAQAREEKKSYQDRESWSQENNDDKEESYKYLKYIPDADADEDFVDDLLTYLTDSDDTEKDFPSSYQNFRPTPDEAEDRLEDLVETSFLNREDDEQRLLTTALLEDMLDNGEKEATQSKWKDVGANIYNDEESENGNKQEDEGEVDQSYLFDEETPTSDGKKLRGQEEKTTAKDSKSNDDLKDRGEVAESQSFQSEKLDKADGFSSVTQSDVDELRSLITQLADSEKNKKPELGLDDTKELDDTDKPEYPNPTHVKQEIKIDVKFPGVSVSQDDTYLCTAVNIDNYTNSSDKPWYITGYTPHADQTVAHHMLLYGCASPGVEGAGAVWNCGGSMLGEKTSADNFPHGGICNGGQPEIVWAWAKAAPEFNLPKDVGFKIGHGTKVRYLVLQVHYKSASVFRGGMKDRSSVTVTATNKRKPRLSGVYILASGMQTVQPHQTQNFDIECQYTQLFPIHPFAFRTHTHALGVEVMGFRVRDAKWTLIGAKNPQLPEAFYPVASKNMTIRHNDWLAARCVMHNFRNIPTRIGSRHTDEMCNFYFMFWVDSKYEKQMEDWRKSCSNGFPWVHWSSLPGYYD